MVSSQAPYGPRLTLPGTALPSLAQARAADTAFARLSLTHLLSSCPRTALETEVRALKTPLAKLVSAYEDCWCKKRLCAQLSECTGVESCSADCWISLSQQRQWDRVIPTELGLGNAEYF